MSKIKKLLTKSILSLFISLLFIFSFAPSAYAQNWFSQSPSEWYTKVYDTNNPTEIFGERYTAAQVEWVIYTILFWLPTKIIGPQVMSCALSGDLSSCIESLFSSSTTQPQPLATSSESLLSAVFLEERPISAITYFKDLARKFKLIPEAQAQGFGFQYALSPVLEMWKASRNVAYGLIILATIILAFMIMFRVKISPQVVISVQSAIPKLVIALILITFSYAIAGFLIDLMYVVIGLVSLVGKGFFPSALHLSSTSIFRLLTEGHFFNINVPLGAIGLMALYLFFFCLILALTLLMTLGTVGVGLGAVLGAVGITSITAGTGGTFGIILIIIGALVLLILLVSLLWMAFKTLWTILKAYVTVLLLTIFAPFQLLLGVISSNFGFGAWLKSFVSNLSTFIVVGVLFLLSFVFLFQGFSLAFQEFVGGNVVQRFFSVIFGTGAVSLFTGSTNASWPPLLGLGGNSGVALLFLGVSFVLFTMIPKASDIIKSMIEGKPFAYGTAIGEVAAPFRMVAGSPPGRVIQDALTRKGTSQTITKVATRLPAGSVRTFLEDLAAGTSRRP
ncbi:hypothetical protein MUP46_01355 [Patescibacteria group bacterium]|nr:hypothetical protein [Patescibacteria group bacterium]